MNVIQHFGKSYSISKSFNIIFFRSYAFKSDLKIKWVRPEKIPCYKPEKSGDLEGIQKPSKYLFPLEFENSKELSTADETVKRLFSLEFAPRNKSTQVYIRNIVEKVKRHHFDVGSMEVKIARQTGAVRALQESMEQHPRNRRMKVELKELIDKRKKYLKYLRRWDYKRFEWLLEVLNIEYKPPPNSFHRVTRKESLVKLTNIHCENIKKERLETYRKLLEAEQPAFLEEKIRQLQFIRNEEKDCGAPVTVKEEDIEEVQKQLRELNEKREKETKIVE